VGLVGLGGYGLVRLSRSFAGSAREASSSRPAPGEPEGGPEAPRPEAPEPEGVAAEPPGAQAAPGDVAAGPEAQPPAGDDVASMEPEAPAPTSPPTPTPAVPPALVEPGCKALPRDTLRLDALVADEALARVWLDSFKPFVPREKPAPGPFKVQGLDVVVVANASEPGQPPRLCLDADQPLADELARAATRAPPSALGHGAWLVPATVPGATVAALVAPGFGQAFPSGGPLLAFAPTDDVIAFADSADPAAVALAASTAAELTPIDAEDGCVTEQPLVRTKTGWAPWSTPKRHPASAALREFGARALECRLALTLNVVATARELTSDAGVLDYELPVLASTEPLAAKDGVHRLVTLEATDVAQVLPQVDVVDADVGGAVRLSMPWATFQRLAGKRLAALELAHRKVPKLWRLEPGLRAKELAGARGVTATPLPEATEDVTPDE
jgi:hypothetical protein